MERTCIEVGNTTFKVARSREEGSAGWDVTRFRTASSLYTGLNGDTNLLLAPVAEERAATLQSYLEEKGCTVQRIERASLSAYLGDSYETPATLGLDRLLNLMGLRGDGVVVSCGTCITVDLAIDRRLRFGAILPGYATAARGMKEAVPALPAPSLEGTPTIPSLTSQNSVDLGILHGTTHAALGIARELCRSEAINQTTSTSVPLVLTGGGAGLMRRMIEELGGVENLWEFGEMISVPGLLFDGMSRYASTLDT